MFPLLKTSLLLFCKKHNYILAIVMICKVHKKIDRGILE